MNDSDTDTLLALVSSLLTPPVPDIEVVLNALVKCHGDVKAAAHFINKSNQRKRANLDHWLVKDSAPKSIGVCTDRESTKRQRKLIMPSSLPPTPAINLMSVLRSPASEKIISRSLPLMLSNPTMVAKNTPCTLHLSALPSELACRLFYTMVHASRNWQRNKWWLFDRMVESPHRTSFFARRDDGIDGDESWQEAAQFW